MQEGINLVVTGEVDDKRSFDVEDGKMYCVTVVGRGFTHEQYLTKEQFEAVPPKGELCTIFGPAKVNKRGDITCSMKKAIVQPVDGGRRRRAA